MRKPNNLSATPATASPKPILIVVLRIFFKLLYHQFAWMYDWVASIVSLEAWQTWVSSVLPYLQGPRVLEIGFGPGHLQVALCQKGLTVYGLDESRQMVRIARSRQTTLGLSSNLVRGVAQTLPFAANCLHQIVMTFPAEYILNSSTLTEIHRVLIDDGVAIILPLAWITGQNPLERLVAWLNRVTGETPEWNENSLAPLKTAGFIVSWEMKKFNTSKILIIRLQKYLPKE